MEFPGLDPVPRRRLRLRLSVRMLMVLVLALGLALGWYVRGVQTQRDAAAVIEAAGGSVAYDWEWGTSNPNIVSYQGKPAAPKWVADRLGVDYVGNVVHVNLVPGGRGPKVKAGDRALASVARLTHLESLWLNGTAVTDAGMVHLKRLPRLHHLTLGGTLVTDAGLAQLHGLSNLRLLYLVGSKVTDEGVLALEEALPRLQVIGEDNLAITANQPRANKDLNFALSLPVRIAAPLLVQRAHTMVARGDMAELVATIDALCDLKADNVYDFVKLAEARGECLGILEPTFSSQLPTSQRRALVKRCADSGVEALRLAIDRGYTNIRRLEGDVLETRMIGNLRTHPAYPRLIQFMNAKRGARGASR